MSNSSRYALRAFRSIQSSTRPRLETVSSQLSHSQAKLPSQRTFHTRSQHLAQAAAASAPAPAPKPTPSSSKLSSTVSTSTTNSAPKTEAPTTSLDLEEGDSGEVDWSRSYSGLGNQAFPKEAVDILLAPIEQTIVEIKPDGIIYLPEIHYRRILNKAFGPGAWGLAPRGETIVTDKAVTREYALVAHGRLVSIARGEQDYFSKDGIPTASEGCKSNAMVRCCKDLGIASELWDPRFIRTWKAKHAKEMFVEHQVTKKRTKHWLRKEDPVAYPWKETSGAASAPSGTVAKKASSYSDPGY